MSSVVDEDVARTVNEGRETLGDVLRSAQKHLQKVFILFVLGLVGTIYFLRRWGWDRMKTDLLSTAEEAVIVAVTPFDVILLQVKIGLVVGAVVSFPLLLYYSRDALKRRGVWPTGVARWKLVLVFLTSVALLLAGAAYGYLLFFPLAFDFLASNAAQAGFEPTYSIVKWAEFVFLLSLSFGLAAQLPLAMAGLASTGIVPYETFRDYWKHAIVILYALGALFTPPDPLTQLMWATPLVVLYGFSLLLTKFLVTAQAAGERVGATHEAKRQWNVLAGVALLAGAAVFLGGRALAKGVLDPYLARYDDVRYIGGFLPDSLATDAVLGLDRAIGLAVLAVVVGLLAAAAILVYLMFRRLDKLVEADARTAGPAPASAGEPGNIDLRELDAAGVRSAPAEVFAEMEEEEALAVASDAMEDDDPEKAQVVLDRFDEAQALVEASPEEAGATAAAANRVDEDGEIQEPGEVAGEAVAEEESNVFTRTGAGMLGAFTEEEVDEDDIGGYYYDIAFVLDSLTSRAFIIVGVFLAVLAGVFSALYMGGIGVLKRDFLRRLPAGVTAEQVNLVTLHPVEALIFEIKVATVIAFAATLPALLYFAWPALKQRGFAGGNRNVLLVWGGSMFAALAVGSVIGYIYVAPGIISWLAADVAQAHMVIAYRVSNFGWLVFFTTVGVGILATIPMSMLLFDAGGLVPYRAMRSRWRVVTLGVFAVIAFLSPRGVFMMFLLGIPVMLAYALGLALLHVATLGGRRGGGHEPVEAAD